MEERRNRFRRLAVALSGFAACGVAAGCELPPGVRLETERIAISYRTIPANIEVGKPFVLELAACPKKGAAVSGRVDWTPICRSTATA